MLFSQQNLVDLGLEFRFVAGTDGHGWFAVEWDVEDCGDGGDAEGCRYVSAVVYVDFVDYDLTFIFLGQFFQYRCYASAWAAPCGCEVDDCGLGTEVFHVLAVTVVNEL